MPKAVSNIDTAFFEDVTAITLTMDDLIQQLAALLDQPEPMRVLSNLHRENRKVRALVFTQRNQIKTARRP